MQQNLISVILPIYNVEDYLDRCLLSLQNQTYANCEFLLIDDGSTDRSLETCFHFAEKDHRFIVIHQENQGPSSARNNGIKNSRGAYIAFVDPDDYVETTYIETLYRVIGDADIAFCGSQKVNRSGTFGLKNNSSYKVSYDMEANYNVWMTKGYLSAPFCKLFDAKIIRKNNIFFIAGLDTLEDFIFLREYMLYTKKIVHCGEILYFQQLRDSSLTGLRANSKIHISKRVFFWNKMLEWEKMHVENKWTYVEVAKLLIALNILLAAKRLNYENFKGREVISSYIDENIWSVLFKAKNNYIRIKILGFYFFPSLWLSIKKALNIIKG